MSFNKDEEEAEAYQEFGDFLAELNKEYAGLASKPKLKKLLEAMRKCL